MRPNADKIIWTENALQELERLLGSKVEIEVEELDESLGGLDFPWPIVIKSITADKDPSGETWSNLIIEFDEVSGAGGYEVKFSLVDDVNQFERYEIQQPEFLFQTRTEVGSSDYFYDGTSSKYVSNVVWNSAYGGYYTATIGTYTHAFNIRRAGDLAILVTSGASETVSGGFDSFDAVIDPGPQDPGWGNVLWPQRLYNLKVVVCRDGNPSVGSGDLVCQLPAGQSTLVNLNGGLLIVPGWSDAQLISVQHTDYPYTGDPPDPPQAQTMQTATANCQPGDLIIAGALAQGGYISGWFPTPIHTTTGFPSHYINYSDEAGYPGGCIIVGGVVDNWDATQASATFETDTIYDSGDRYRSGGGCFIAVFRKP